MSAAVKDANVILAVTTHVDQNNNITFTDDNGLLSLLERWSFESPIKARLCLIKLIGQPGETASLYFKN